MNPLRWPRPRWIGVVALFAVLFGLATLREGGAVLFVDGGARRAAGDYVPFVLAFNFLAGFLYIAAGVGLLAGKRWAVSLSFAIAALTLAVFAALGVHILGGGAYELRTVVAMALRTGFWWAVAWAAHRHPSI